MSFLWRKPTHFTRDMLVIVHITHCCAGILEQSIGARNRVRIRLSYRSARLHRLVESIPRLHKSLKIPSLSSYKKVTF